jgi:hypothetical protein
MSSGPVVCMVSYLFKIQRNEVKQRPTLIWSSNLFAF